MNLEQTPTIEQLKALVAQQDDSAYSHLLWVDMKGEVRIQALGQERSPLAFVRSRPDLLLQYETYCRGNGYVGAKAANDETWMKRLFTSLQKEWEETKGSSKGHFVEFM